jgi:hypothetical protein
MDTVDTDDYLHYTLANKSEAWAYLSSDLSVELFGRPWYEKFPSWEAYTLDIRDKLHYESQPLPYAGAGFLDCLTWYFHDCTVQAGLNAPPAHAWGSAENATQSAFTPENYNESLRRLFEDFYLLFYEAYTEMHEMYLQDVPHFGAYFYPDAYVTHVHESGDAGDYQPDSWLPAQPADEVHEVLERFADPNGAITAAEVQQISPYITVEQLDTPPR